jgi:hypothetical protein
MFNIIQNTLQEVIDLLKQLDNQVYITPNALLSNATIGQHTRHIIELFQCLLQGYDAGKVNYDKRTRNKVIENDTAMAVLALYEIQQSLEQDNKDLEMEYELGEKEVALASNYFRELMYNLEHCIHHQALIKVALINLPALQIAENFGIAPSTVQYRKVVG